MQLQQLRYFLAVANAGSISAAAKQLFIAQPTLSQQILNLEQELGVPLLIRHARSVSLSEAGIQFAVHAQRIIGETDQLKSLMKKHSLLQAGTIRLGLLWVAGYLDLFELLGSYQAQYPELRYELKIDGSRNLLQLLDERRLHAVFVIGEENHFIASGYYYQKIMDDSYTLMVPSAHPLAAKSCIGIKDLYDVPLIMPAPASAFRARLDRLFEEHQFKPRILCETSQSETVAYLTARNLGIGFSSYSIAKKLKSDAQVLIPFAYKMYRTIYYVTLRELLDYPSIHAFTRFVSHYPFDEMKAKETT